LIFGLNEADFFAVIVFGIVANFAFSLYFGFLLQQNIKFGDIVNLMRSRKTPQPWYFTILIIIPFGKVFLVLWRVYVLQIYFLNRGRSYHDFMKYMIEHGK
jgi:hypothetical protein